VALLRNTDSPNPRNCEIHYIFISDFFESQKGSYLLLDDRQELPSFNDPRGRPFLRVEDGGKFRAIFSPPKHKNQSIQKVHFTPKPLIQLSLQVNEGGGCVKLEYFPIS
jgi:hypothetical protein